MKHLTLVFVLALAACTPVPIKQKFPEAIPELKEKCPDLKQIEGDKVAITDLLKSVITNYNMYYECSLKNEGWNKWYTEQRKIYESVK
jgi:hypothetical protein